VADIGAMTKLAKSIGRTVAALCGCLLIGWQLIVGNFALLGTASGSPARALAFDPADSVAHDALAITALDARKLGEAHRQAIAALAGSPIDQSALTVAAVSGPDAQQSALLALTAGLGWRDLPTQVLLARQGIRQGNAELFAQRFDAYERQSTGSSSILPLLDQYIGNVVVQAAILPRLVADPSWRDPYLSGLSNNDPGLVAARKALLVKLSGTERPADRGELRAFVSSLNTAGFRPDAYDVWRHFMAAPDAWSGLLYDGAFRHVGGDTSSFPYEWTLHDADGAYATVELNDRISQLHVHSEGLAQGALVTQNIRLAAGSYRFSLRANLQDGAPEGRSSDFAISLRCGSNKELLEGPDGLGLPVNAGGGRFPFVVPANCDEQLMTIGATPGSAAVPSDLWLSDARIDHVG
jgi:hypothetical protein